MQKVLKTQMLTSCQTECGRSESLPYRKENAVCCLSTALELSAPSPEPSEIREMATTRGPSAALHMRLSDTYGQIVLISVAPAATQRSNAQCPSSSPRRFGARLPDAPPSLAGLLPMCIPMLIIERTLLLPPRDSR